MIFYSPYIQASYFFKYLGMLFLVFYVLSTLSWNSATVLHIFKMEEFIHLFQFFQCEELTATFGDIPISTKAGPRRIRRLPTPQRRSLFRSCRPEPCTSIGFEPVPVPSSTVIVLWELETEQTCQVMLGSLNYLWLATKERRTLEHIKNVFSW